MKVLRILRGGPQAGWHITFRTTEAPDPLIIAGQVYTLQEDGDYRYQGDDQPSSRDPRESNHL